MDIPLIARQLQQQWKGLIVGNSSELQDKLKGLDSFLDNFLSFSEEDITILVSSIRNFPNICNLLLRQLKSDVRSLLEENQDLEEGKDALRKYLLNGNGWKILSLVGKVAVKDMQHSADLINFLMTLLANCLSLEVPQNVLNLGSQPKQIENCVYFKLCNHSKISTEKECNAKKNNKRDKNKKPKLYQMSTRWLHARECPRFHWNSSDEEPQRIRRSSSIQLATRNFGYVSDSNDGSDQESESMAAAMEPFSRQSASCEKRVSALEVCADILCLLHKITMKEQISFTEGRMLSSTILEFCCSLLHDIQDGVACVEWGDRERLLLAIQVSKVAISSAGAVTVGREGNAFSLSDNEFVPFLMEFGNYFAPSTSSEPEEYYDFRIELMYTIAKGLVLILQKLVDHSLEVFNPSLVIQMSVFITSSEGQAFLCSLISKLDERDEFEEYKRNFITSLGQVVLRLKSSRYEMEQTDRTNSPRITQIACHLLHHHVDVFGSSGTCSFSKQIPMCAVAAVSRILLTLLNFANLDKTRHIILKTFSIAGVCCCMNFQNTCHLILKDAEDMSPRLQRKIIRVIETAILPQLGHVSSGSARVNCVTCSERQLDSPGVVSTDTGNNWLGAREATLSCDRLAAIVEEAFGEENNPRSSVTFYLNILKNSKNRHFSRAIFSHLLRVIRSGTSKLRNQLYLQVVLPIFFASFDDDGASSEEDKLYSSEVTLFSLSALYLLFYHSVSSAVFLSLQGLKYLSHSLHSEELRETALKVFQVLMDAEAKVMDLNDCNVCHIHMSPSPIYDSGQGGRVDTILHFHELIQQYTAEYQHLVKHVCKGTNGDAGLHPGNALDGSFLECTGNLDTEKASLQKLTHQVKDIWTLCRDLVWENSQYRSFIKEQPLIVLAYDLSYSVAKTLVYSGSLLVSTCLSSWALLEALVTMTINVAPFHLPLTGRVTKVTKQTLRAVEHFRLLRSARKTAQSAWCNKNVKIARESDKLLLF